MKAVKVKLIQGNHYTYRLSAAGIWDRWYNLDQAENGNWYILSSEMVVFTSLRAALEWLTNKSVGQPFKVTPRDHSGNQLTWGIEFNR